MIAKGTTHNSGGRLASYMVTGKDGERAELWQLRGFASDDIKEAFRDVHTMADATQCEKPFFHVQVRNREGEHLSGEQWERVANRIESKLGYSGQPRAIAFHSDEKTGGRHMHIAWSRIDDETMTAKALPFFKLRLKEASRELETELGLTPVKNHRDTPVLAPNRDEFEQARRLGIDIHSVRDQIRECWERSDNGQSFRAALADEGLMLAKGDKRDFIAIDQEGGIHALGKRILGNTAGEIRARTADLDRDQLPTIDQAREQLARVHELPGIDRTDHAPAPGQRIEAPVPHESAARKIEEEADSRAELPENEAQLAAERELFIKLNEAAMRGPAELFDGVVIKAADAVANTAGKVKESVAEFMAPAAKERPASEGEEQEPVDWRRLLTDADYRRQMKERRIAEQQRERPQPERGPDVRDRS